MNPLGTLAGGQEEPLPIFHDVTVQCARKCEACGGLREVRLRTGRGDPALLQESRTSMAEDSAMGAFSTFSSVKRGVVKD